MKSTRLTFRNLGGVDQDKDPAQLLNEKLTRGAAVFGMLAGNGKLIGDKCGVGVDYLGGTLPTKPILRNYKWEHSDGHTYHIGYQSDGGGVDGQLVFWADVEPNSSGSTAVAITGLGAVLPTNMIPCFADPGNGYLYVACGQKGLYKLFPTTPGTAITATVVTTLPAASFIGVANNRLWIIPMDETMILWGPQGDYERLQPKLAEIDADTYGIDYRVTYQSQGLEGNTTGFFVCDAYKIAWTQKDAGIIIGDGNKKTTAFSRLPGFGLRNQLGYIQKDGVLYWQSGYKGGRILGGTMGSAPSGVEVLKSVVAQNFSFFVWDASANIQDILKDCPVADCQIISKVLDSRGDWEDTANNITSLTSFDTVTDPGMIQLKNDAALTSTVSGFITEDILGGTIYVSTGVDGSHTIDKTYDKDPATYFKYLVNLNSAYTNTVIAGALHVWGNGTWQHITTDANLTSGSAGIKDIKRYTTAVLIQFSVSAVRSSPTGSGTVRLNMYYDLGGLKYLDSIDFTNLVLTLGSSGGGGTASIQLNEIYFNCGVVADSYLTSQVFKITGLTTANNALNTTALGRFYLRYIGTLPDGTGGLTNTGAPTVPQIRGRGTTFNYNTGDTGATDVQWYSLTAGDLTQGVDLQAANKTAGGGGTPPAMNFTPDANGVLYVQFRIPMVRSSTGVTPKVDSAGFYFWTGNNQKSISPAGSTQDYMFFGIRQNGDSANPDMEIVRHDNGEWTVLKGKQPFSYLNHRDQCYICEGSKIYKQFDGANNYDEAGNSAYMERRWRSGAIQMPGANVYLKQLQFHVDKYEGIKTQQTTSNTLVDTNVAMSGMTNGAWDRKASFIGYDGYLYAVLPSATANYLTHLKLYRIDQTTGTNTTYTILTNTDTSGHVIIDYDCAKRPDGKFIYIAYFDIATKYLKLAVYDVINRKVIRNENVNPASMYPNGTDYPGFAYTGVTCEYLNGVVHIVLGFITTASNAYTHHWYCENPDDESLGFYNRGNGGMTITDYAATALVPRLFKNSDGFLSLIYAPLAGGVLYHREYRPTEPINENTQWNDAQTIATIAGAFYSGISHKDNDYIAIYDDPSGPDIYKRKPTWAAYTGITPIALGTNLVAVNKDNNPVVLNQGTAETRIAFTVYRDTVQLLMITGA